MTKHHSFHIPVMGIGFTIDTPLKVSHLGIDSVISLVDDILIEKLRKMYCNLYELPYKEITDKIEDFRAKRITSYLNLIQDLANEKFNALKSVASNKKSEIKAYFNMLPDNSTLKQEFKKLTADHFDFTKISKLIKDNLSMGSIDVNIMTKADKANYLNGEKLSAEYNDAHAALRGFANSDLESSVILSAGMSPRLYSYIAEFEDFFPDSNGLIKKKIVLKVSDYRSASIQGKFLAKKGLWVSEYRIESGLNCGGHAFATNGYLLGPVLEEFKTSRDELYDSVYEIYLQALANKEMTLPKTKPIQKITAQGGIGTSEEHDFLISHYQLDSAGWGTPFLLVPDATTVDDATRQKLVKAKEEDLYLSDISPLGVPFNNLKANTKDREMHAYILKGRSGSPCPKKFLAFNNEFTDQGICTASRQYQNLKLKELDNQNLPFEEYQFKFDKIVEKSCICVGLGTSVLLANNMSTKVEKEGVSICPGPNLAYFSKTMSLAEITDHIYGRANVISRSDRPHMFLKEINIYIEYLMTKIDEASAVATKKQTKYLMTFVTNLSEGIEYYNSLFSSLKTAYLDTHSNFINKLDKYKRTLQLMKEEIEGMGSLKLIMEN